MKYEHFNFKSRMNAIFITLFSLLLTYGIVFFQEANSPMRLQYRVHVYGHMHAIARTFHVDKELLHSLNLPTRDFYELTSHSTGHFVFVTAASRDLFVETTDLVMSLQKKLPGQKLLYFDVGLSQEQIQQVCVN
jgi:hypothetical protein